MHIFLKFFSHVRLFSVGWSVGLMIGQSVCHNILKVQETILACSYRSIRFLKHLKHPWYGLMPPTTSVGDKRSQPKYIRPPRLQFLPPP